MRMVVHLGTCLIMLNKDFKSITYDSVPFSTVPSLAFRSFALVTTFYFMQAALMALPLVEVALVLNTVPFLTAILAYFILGDRLRVFEIICLIISFCGVVILIMGT